MGGERSIKFELFQETKDGLKLDTKEEVQGLTKEQQKFMVCCEVSCASVQDLSGAQLTVAGVPFGDLKEPRKDEGEDLTLHPDVMQMQYSIAVPHSIGSAAALAAMKHDFSVGFGNLLSTITGARGSTVSALPTGSGGY